jgi:2-polyprenyl-3-methyl-5-hydroxy-6-metoxy-1,4-benzoquinol methylase
MRRSLKDPFSLFDFSKRNREAEIMDDPALDPLEHFKALRGLERINRWTGTPEIFWKAIQGEVKKSARPLRILDVASGGGDIPVGILKQSRRLGVPIKIDGCDFSPRAVEYAQEHARSQGADVDFFELDIFKDQIPTDYDIIISSLFLHHLETKTVTDLLRRMAAAAKKMVVIYDLERNFINWILVYLGTRLLSTSPVVHTDGPLSVQAAFTTNEINKLAEEAGLRGASISHHFPAR